MGNVKEFLSPSTAGAELAQKRDVAIGLSALNAAVSMYSAVEKHYGVLSYAVIATVFFGLMAGMFEIKRRSQMQRN
ncbi:MAG: hypothetical protein M1524_04425 [Patescibacteria group bacterium]|nr:hypothetical protein [Patescibacteria group bacterium]